MGGAAEVGVPEREILKRFECVEATADDHEDAVADVDRRQPMRDHEEGQAAPQSRKGSLDQPLGGGIERTSRLIEHEHLRTQCKSPCEADSLGLPD